MDNRKKIIIWEIANLVFCLIFSTFNHFLYELSNECALFAPFVPVNESVWEHAKLLFMPFFFFAIIEGIFIKNKNYCFAKCVPLLISTPLMVTLFYTYTGIIGFNITVIDVMISMLILVFMCYISYKSLINPKKQRCYWFYPTLVIIMFILLIVFTFYPPSIPLFISS